MKTPTEALKRLIALSLCLCLPGASAPALAQTFSARTGAPPSAASPAAPFTGPADLAPTPDLSAPLSLRQSFPDLSLPDIRLQPGLNIVPEGTLSGPLRLAAPVQAEPALPALAAAPPALAPEAAPAAASARSLPAARVEEAATAAEAEEAPRASSRNLLSLLKKAFRLGGPRKVFEGGRVRGAAFAPGELEAPEGVEFDPTPVRPLDSGFSWSQDLLAETGRPSLIDRLRGRAPSGPTQLPGDPQDAPAVEAALLNLIRDNPSQFGGVTPDSLTTLLSRKVAGRHGLADVVYVNFQQNIGGVPIEGATLSFTVQLADGKALLASSWGHVEGPISVEAAGGLGESEVLARAEAKLGPVESSGGLTYLERRILNVGGRWRAVGLLRAHKKGLLVGVDAHTGEAFVWDPRLSARVEGSAEGRGMKGEPLEMPTELDLMPLAHLEITTSQGRTFFSDEKGNFTVEGEGDQPVTIKVKLRGKYAVVETQTGTDMEVTATARPGERLQVVFNPATIADERERERAVAQVNGYHFTTLTYDYLKSRDVFHQGIEAAVPVKVNEDDDCNAFYDYVAVHFFLSSSRCNNTARATVVPHENGHRWHMTAGKRRIASAMLMAAMSMGGISEGWGDILAIFMTRQPVLGGGFFRDPNKRDNFIRHAENTYQYRSGDEVHREGQAWMGFAWKLYKNLIPKLGEQKALALVEALILPVVFTGVTDIPMAIQQVLVRDTGADGVAPHFKEIEAAAKAHGIKVKPARRGDSAIEWLSGWVGGIVRAFSGPAEPGAG